jgi:ABC-2 type transport system permease protein
MSVHAAPGYGPSALGGGARRFVELTMTLAKSEFKVRYFGSALGYLWSLMRPLMFFGVLYVIFTKVLHIGQGVPHYGVYLLTSIVFWTYFSEATGNCVTCLLAREGLLRKVRFPRMVVPLSVSLTSAFNLGMNFIAVLVFALASGVEPTLSWLWMIPIAIGFIVLATGSGMLLSALYVRYRDVQPIWEVLVAVLFYSAPIMYVASSYKNLEHVAMANPFAMLLTQMGHAFIHAAPVATCVGGTGPSCVGGTIVLEQRLRSATAAAGGPLPVIIAIAIIPAVFALGWWVFTREAPRVAENL